MPESPISNRESELLRGSIDKLNLTVESLTEQIAETYVRKDVYAADRRADERRLSGLENFRDWGVRLVLSLVIVAVVSLAIVQGT